jgi:hypothetical protein
MSHEPVDFKAGQCAAVWKDRIGGFGASGEVHCCALEAFHTADQHRCSCGKCIATWNPDARTQAEQPPRGLLLVSETRRALKGEAHKMWFDAINDYAHRLEDYPEVDPFGLEADTVKAFVKQVLEPLLDKRKDLYQEVQRLRAELAARPARLSVVKGDESGG